MPIAGINNCDLYYEMKGDGPDVVFIHGEDQGIEMFEQQLAQPAPQHCQPVQPQ
jgi:hypothetical protein